MCGGTDEEKFNRPGLENLAPRVLLTFTLGGAVFVL